MESVAYKSVVGGNQKLEMLLVNGDITVKEALKRMDEAAERILIVVDEANKVCGTITDGDIRRWILKEGSLNAPVANFYHRNPKTVPESYDPAEVKELMIRHRIVAVPVVNEKGCLSDVLLWDDLLAGKKHRGSQVLTAPVVIMAGGKGVRMDPITRILPKPLIPLGDKPIVELIMDRFAEFGCEQFFLTVSYKGKMVQSYFENAERTYDIKFVWEDRPRGTIGGLRLVSDLITTPSFFVTNCDILVDADYSDLFQFHQDTDSAITIVSSMQHFSIPYGVLEIVNDGVLAKIIEKPEYDFWVNTGMYVVEKEIVKYIPEEESCDFPDLISCVKKEGGKISVYPVSQSSWIDAGQWHEYQSAVQKVDKKLDVWKS